jgi:hypothetical protein
MFTKERITMVVWVAVFLAVLIAIRGKEERYMLPAYPAIALFSGIVIENVRCAFNGLHKNTRYLGDIIVVILFFLTGEWCLRMGLDCIFKNCAIYQFF